MIFPVKDKKFSDFEFCRILQSLCKVFIFYLLLDVSDFDILSTLRFV